MAKIAINTRYLLKDKLEGFGWYSYEVARRLAENHPKHQFYFFFDRPFDPNFVFSKNITPIVLGPPARHPILHYIWNEWSVRKALKKYSIDVYFSPDGYLSLKTKTKQLITIHDINFEHYPEDLPLSARKYYRFFFPKFAIKSDKILTVSNFSKSDIIQHYGISDSKIRAIWNGVSEKFVQISEEVKVKIKHKYSYGQDYFIFVGSLNPRKNLRRLVAAYELYASNKEHPWHLVIVGEKMWRNQTEHLSISTSIESQIHFTGRLNDEELSKAVAAAGAMTFVPYFEGFGIPMVEAMRCGVPVLAGNLSSLPEIGQDAVLYCDPFDTKSIAEGLEQISNDSLLRQKLTSKGLERSKAFSWDKCAEAVWEEIEKLLQ
ncbi:MAG: glycosyltransferase family 1 protein [Bacteroidota bacterium]